MRLLKGQRWMWNNIFIVEIMEDKEFDEITETFRPKVEEFREDRSRRSCSDWTFGRNCGIGPNKWRYLEGQDKPMSSS